MDTLSLSIQGMSCGGCVGKVSAALKACDVVGAEVAWFARLALATGAAGLP